MTVIFKIESVRSVGRLPWTYGHPFPRGMFRRLKGRCDGQFQYEVRNRWPDGSIKFAVLSGITNFALGESLVEIEEATEEETAMFAVEEPPADWLDRNAVVDITGEGMEWGVYTPGDARRTGHIEWDRSRPHKVREILGSVMSEFHYFTPTCDPGLHLWWYVRAYADGNHEIDVWFENGWAGGPSRTVFYGARVEVGGVELFNVPMITVPSWNGVRRLDERTLQFPNNSCRSAYPVGCSIRLDPLDEDPYRVEDSAFSSRLGTTLSLDRDLPAEIGDYIYRDGHVAYTRWSRLGWTAEDPLTAPVHDPDVLRASHFFPNYYMGDGGVPSAAVLDNLHFPTLPFERGATYIHARNMGAVGSNTELLPRLEALYAKTGDPTVWESMVAHARCAGRYALAVRCDKTGEPVEYSRYPRHAYHKGQNVSARSLGPAIVFPFEGLEPPIFKMTHMPILNYGAYLTEGRTPFREQIEWCAQAPFWITNSENPTNIRNVYHDGHRVLKSRLTCFVPRGVGWSIRQLNCCIATMPDNHPRRQQYIRHAGKTWRYYLDTHVGRNVFGLVQPNLSYYGDAGLVTANFQQDYINANVGWFGHLSAHAMGEYEPAFWDFLHWKLSHIVGRFGTDAGFCYRRAAHYLIRYSDVDGLSSQIDEAEFHRNLYQTWRDAYETTLAVYYPAEVDDPCWSSNMLTGRSGSNPKGLTSNSNSYWAIAMTALALAKDHGVSGAGAAWERLTSAPNFNPKGFRNLPDWGIWPR